MALQKMRGQKPAAGEVAVIVGAGRSGMAAARLLAKSGAHVRLLEKDDSLAKARSRELAELDVELISGPHESRHFAKASFIIPSPAMPIASAVALVPKGESPEILSEMELAWRYLDNEPIIGITGTSGKTTTASLAAAMLKAQGYSVFLGGNIGTPLSEYALDDRKADALVLELSSFQLQGCSTFCPRVGVLLNISPNHLDYHKSMEEYEEAKFRLFRCQDEGDLAIIDENLREIANRYPIAARKLWLEGAGRFPKMKLFGRHNALNAEAAWQAARFFGVAADKAALAVENFAPLPHRLERVGEINGVIYVNDSKCTTVDALRAALESFERPVRLLCGGKFKGGDLEALRPLVRNKVAEVALFGASREHFENAWRGVVPISWSQTLEEATHILAASANSGDVILLAPATSSFDAYKNYQERGNDFKRIVENLS